MTRKRSRLNLHRTKGTNKRVQKAFLWTDSYTEVVGSNVPYKVRPMKQRTLSPIKSPISLKYGKRLLSPSPAQSPLYISMKKNPTPSKSPFRKRAKICLEASLEVPDTLSTTCTQNSPETPADMSEISIEAASLEVTNTLPKPCAQKTPKTPADTSERACGEEDDIVLEEMKTLLSNVVNNLTEAGFEHNILNFFRQVNDDTYPFQNIAFLLWMETVKWFSQENSSHMRYSDDTKKFWKLGYRMFGGRLIRFMSGYKNEEQVVRK